MEVILRSTDLVFKSRMRISLPMILVIRELTLVFHSTKFLELYWYMYPQLPYTVGLIVISVIGSKMRSALG